MYKVTTKKLFDELVLKDRSELGILMERLRGKTMIEIGVQEGDFADKILSKWPSFEQYYGIDPWPKQINNNDFANVENNQQEDKYQITKKRLSKYWYRID